MQKLVILPIHYEENTCAGMNNMWCCSAGFAAVQSQPSRYDKKNCCKLVILKLRKPPAKPEHCQ